MLNDPRVKNFARKCGADLRKYTPHLYGGYSYGKSLEHGREIYAAFRAAVDEHPGLGPDVKMILKRGCTEMEAMCGPSNEWKIDPKHKRIEEMCAAAISFEPNEADSSDHHLRHVHRIWIEHACMSGDETYLHYTGGQPIHGKYITYHEPDKAPAQKKGKKEKK